VEISFAMSEVPHRETGRIRSRVYWQSDNTTALTCGADKELTTENTENRQKHGRTRIAVQLQR
jgi:hypothetical protein